MTNFSIKFDNMLKLLEISLTGLFMKKAIKRTTLSTLLLCTSIITGCTTTNNGTNSYQGSSQNHFSSSSNYQKTEQFYNKIIGAEEANVAALNLFMTQMPKGGDIHHHYSGTIYAETYLDWVKKKDWRINSCSLTIITNNKASEGECQALTVDQLMGQGPLFRKLLTLWSDKDFDNHYHEQPAPDTNFFGTFMYFGAAANVFQETGMQLLKQRALAENVTYIETQYSRTGAKAKNYVSPAQRKAFIAQLQAAKTQAQVNKVLDSISESLTKHDEFNSTVNSFIKEVETIHQSIDDANFTMRYQTYTARVQDPLQVYTELFSGFIASNQSPLIVGVNIVAPENHHVSLENYTLHMQMYNYLHNKYPKVNRALHAGELTLGMVRPKNLLFHIGQARSIAKAQRIGHGIDLPYEQNSLALLEDLKQNAAIEINLTSNEFILGVEGNAHPYLIYEKYGVPLVISTDDSGVSRNNLSGEFVLLASRYKPSYQKVKEYVYNSIHYSFMSDADKATNVQRLDDKFKTFEAEMAGLAEKL